MEPYNTVASAWQNPTVIKFETTTAVASVISEAGAILNQASLLVRAPAGFTFICPTLGWAPPSLVVPPGYIKVPQDAECYINHQVAELRRDLRINFRSEGLKKDTRYIFEVEIVNADSVNPTTNLFQLTTFVDSTLIEQMLTVPGYALAQKMDNTRYSEETVNGIDIGADLRVDHYKNWVSFMMGLTAPLPPNSVLEVGAPVGFRFPPICIAPPGSDGYPIQSVGYQDRTPSKNKFPDDNTEIFECKSLASETGEENKIRITLGVPMFVGEYWDGNGLSVDRTCLFRPVPHVGFAEWSMS